MKKLLPLFSILFIVIVIAACNSKPRTDVNNVLTSADTIGLAEFQKWKRHSLVVENPFPDAEPDIRTIATILLSG